VIFTIILCNKCTKYSCWNTAISLSNFPTEA